MEEFEEVKYIIYYWDWFDTDIPVIASESPSTTPITSIDDFSFDKESKALTISYTKDGSQMTKTANIEVEGVEDITDIVLNPDDSIELFFKKSGTKSVKTSVEKLEDDIYWDDMENNS